MKTLFQLVTCLLLIAGGTFTAWFGCNWILSNLTITTKAPTEKEILERKRSGIIAALESIDNGQVPAGLYSNKKQLNDLLKDTEYKLSKLR